MCCMSNIEIQKRNKAVKIADAINDINGVPVSDFAKELTKKWAEDTISDSKMIEKLIDKHKQP